MQSIKELQAEIATLREANLRKDDALRACRAVIATPLARRKFAEHWDEYWEDAHRRIFEELGPMG
jgi:hypothetical protein